MILHHSYPHNILHYHSHHHHLQPQGAPKYNHSYPHNILHSHYHHHYYLQTQGALENNKNNKNNVEIYLMKDELRVNLTY